MSFSFYFRYYDEDEFSVRTCSMCLSWMPESLFIDHKVENNTVSVQKNLLFRNHSDPDDIDIINLHSLKVK